MTTIKIDLKRALDIEPTDVVRLTPNRDWQFVYNSARGGMDEADTEDSQRLSDELDERYVVLRLAVDPKIILSNKYDDTLHTWIEHPALISGGLGERDRPRYFGVPSELDDTLVVLHQFDLVEVQTVVQTGANQDRSEGTHEH